MRGIESVTSALDTVRFKISRLIELERVPRTKGQALLDRVIEARDLASELEFLKEEVPSYGPEFG